MLKTTQKLDNYNLLIEKKKIIKFEKKYLTKLEMTDDNDDHISKRQRTNPIDELLDSSDSDEDFEDSTFHRNNIQNLYLETVNRSRLDFDFEKNCSISLSNANVYSCLVCGKYLQGRGKSSYAFLHSINENHHIFINLSTLRIYILPENYQVEDEKILSDVKYLVKPTYEVNMVEDLYKSKEMSFDLNHKEYRPGFIGMNNSNNTNDYANVVIQLLAHVNQLRDSMLLYNSAEKDELVQQFSLVVQKLWSSRLFKSHMSPHALMQLISKKSNKKFSLNVKSDPKLFLVWFLNNLNQSLSVANKKSIISKIFQGKLALGNDKLTKFWLLSLELPYHSFFKDGIGSEDIPQVSLSSLLSSSKFNKKLKALPHTLILHFNRFGNSEMTVSSISGSTRNPTVVKFPLEMDMSPYLIDNTDGPVNYRLVCNIVHELVPLTSLENKDTDTNNYKIQLLDKVRDEWLLIHDMEVGTTEKELLFLKESYIQFWERV